MVARTNDNAIERVLSKGADQIIDRNHLSAALRSGKKLRVKLGIDPTSPDLHLGHAVVLRKLKAFQDLGHTVVLIIGDFTGQIGDPSGKSKTRPALTESEVKKNMKDYLDQAGRILNVRKIEVRKNSEWHKKGGLAALLQLARAVTVQQTLEREDFKNRIKGGEAISVLESLYPLLQGYDSVAVEADVELGGTDQLFNLLMGRRVQRYFGMKEQDVLTTPLLVGLDGSQKMSKSLGNYVGLMDAPDDMFGKIMSLPDALMSQYFELATDLDMNDVKKFQETLSPRDLKARLALEIVKLYHGEKKAKMAEEKWEKKFVKKEISDDIPAYVPAHAKECAAEIVHDIGIQFGISSLDSKSKSRRLVEQGGFKINDEVVSDPMKRIELKSGDVLRVGKLSVFRVKF